MKYGEAVIKVEEKNGEIVWLSRVAVMTRIGVVHMHARVRAGSPADGLREICQQTLELYPEEYRDDWRARRIADAALAAEERFNA